MDSHMGYRLGGGIHSMLAETLIVWVQTGDELFL